ncbi:hypothetical protein F4777DRAFT_597539 [Nemania sp. FL0916]|nr:hypothetical protein F4777DRAFT_597539 [Nemania sp. FL0916]
MAQKSSGPSLFDGNAKKKPTFGQPGLQRPWAPRDTLREKVLKQDVTDDQVLSGTIAVTKTLIRRDGEGVEEVDPEDRIEFDVAVVDEIFDKLKHLRNVSKAQKISVTFDLSPYAPGTETDLYEAVYRGYTSGKAIGDTYSNAKEILDAPFTTLPEHRDIGKVVDRLLGRLDIARPTGIQRKALAIIKFLRIRH